MPSALGAQLQSITPAWRSEDETVIAVGAGGTLTPKAVGQTRVIGSACGFEDSVTVHVESQPPQLTFLGDSTYAQALNDSGDVVGYTRRGGLTYWLWSGGSRGLTPGCRPVDVNDRRDALCLDGGPTVWRDGALTQLDYHQAVSGFINDSGQVLMSFAGESGPQLWTLDGQLSSRGQGAALALNNSGAVLLGRYSSFTAFFMNDGSTTHRVTTDHTRIGASDMNDSGVVVGYINCHGCPLWTYSAAIWRPNTPIYDMSRPRGSRGDLLAGATTINNRGDIGGSGRAGAFLLRDGRLYVLSQVLADPDWTVLGVTDLNDRAALVGLVRNTVTGSYGSALVSWP